MELRSFARPAAATLLAALAITACRNREVGKVKKVTQTLDKQHLSVVYLVVVADDKRHAAAQAIRGVAQRQGWPKRQLDGDLRFVRIVVDEVQPGGTWQESPHAHLRAMPHIYGEG